ncbi:sigma-70 family RNA polymerase sigma factor [candidate division KSB1 bacterium]|nr:sigma-70 family RNA polymerase sigma factor [candidate division KSB1 bacterium]
MNIKTRRSMNSRWESEKELIQRAQNGDKKAMAGIVKNNESIVYNTALKLLGNEQEAECVLQETFLKVFKALPGFKGESSLSTWIYRIATNFALMRLRSRKKESVTFDIADEQINQNMLESFNQTVGDNPLHAVINDELKQAMEKAIRQLSPKFKTVFVLKDIDGYSLKEISEMLEMSLPAVKSNLHRARLALRNQLAHYVGSEKVNT